MEAAANGLDFADEDGEGGFGHPMAVSLEFVEFGRGMPDHLHHSHHVGVFFVATQHFHLAVAGDEDQGWGIGSDMKQGCHGIDDGLGVFNALLLPRGKMGDGMAAEGNKACDSIGIHVVCCQPSFVQTDHGCEVASSRMARDKNLRWISSMGFNFLKRPGDGCGRIFDIDRTFNFGKQAVVGSYDDHSLILEASGNAFCPPAQAASMKPHQHGKGIACFRQVDIQLALFYCISIHARLFLCPVWHVRFERIGLAGKNG